MCELIIMAAAAFSGQTARGEAPCTLTLSVDKATYEPMEPIPLTLSLVNTGENGIDVVVVDTVLDTWEIDVLRSSGAKALPTVFGRSATVNTRVVSTGIERLPPPARRHTSR